MTTEFTGQKIFSVFNGSESNIGLPTLCGELLEKQKRIWMQLNNHYALLEQSDYRDLSHSGFSFRIQFNPGRIVSARAKIDPQSIAGRKCFLCLENLPEPQQGILYRREYLILCNPWPIFSRHFTISHNEHRPQAVNSCFSAMLEAAKDLSPEYSVFYNGPRCGASAPDHLHIQAVPAGAIPLEGDIADQKNKQPLQNIGTVRLFRANTPERSVIIMEGGFNDDLLEAVGKMMKVLMRHDDDAAEPMINILCTYRKDLWTVVVFPRQKFRPDVYSLEGEQQILISPGAVEMGGFIVTPRKEDFDKLNMGIIDALFREVSLNGDRFENLIEALRKDVTT